MKILFRLHKAEIGGSQRSFLQLAALLSSEGYEIEFAGQSGDWIEDGRFFGFVFHEIPFRPFRWGSFAGAWKMYRLLREKHYDLVHVNGAYTAFETALPAAMNRTPLVLTLPGGRLPLLPTSDRHSVVCFSQELKDSLLKRGKRKRVWMVGNRLDFEAVVRLDNTRPGPDLKQFLSPRGKYLLVMTTRMDPGKEKAIRYLLEAVKLLRKRRVDFDLVLVGGGRYFDEISRRVENMSGKEGEEYIHLPGQVKNPIPLLKRADLVLGVGLSALEGAVFGKPVLIVGENGFAGVVNKDNIEGLEYFNFSGRNLDRAGDPADLAEELDRLLDAPELRKDVGEFARNHVQTRLDLPGVIPIYSRIYQSARENSEPALLGSIRAALFTIKAMIECTVKR